MIRIDFIIYPIYPVIIDLNFQLFYSQIFVRGKRININYQIIFRLLQHWTRKLLILYEDLKIRRIIFSTII